MIGYYAYFRYVEPHAPDWLHRWAELLWRHFHEHHYLEALLPASLRSKVRDPPNEGVPGSSSGESSHFRPGSLDEAGRGVATG